MRYAISCILLLLCAFGCGTNKFDVRQRGAAGDGKALDTGAFQGALDACAKSGGGEVVVPAGNYLVGSVVIPSNTTLRFEKGATITGSPNKEDYPIVNIRWEGRWREGHRALFHAEKADRIAIVGEGTIVGDPKLAYLRDPRGPCIIEPIECTNVRLEGFSIRYIRMWAVHLTYCRDVVARRLNIWSDPKPSNGDGIDIDSSRNVLIEDCEIDTGDDAIALKSGRGMEAVRIARPTEDVTIRNCKLGSSFAAIALGTEMSGGIRNVRVENCTLTRGSNGIFIKSRTGRGGFIENIAFQNVVSKGPRTFLRIDLLTKGIQDSEPVTGDAAFPRVSNIRVNNLQVECDTLVDANLIDPEQPLRGLALTNFSGSTKRAMTLKNVIDPDVREIHVRGDTRAEFLKIIDRPRVEPMAQFTRGQSPDGVEEYHFSFIPDLEQRVFGIMLKPRGASGRHPVVIVMHGTGGDKEQQRPLMKELADKGFIAVAIDGRYHGQRTKAGKGSAEYMEAIVRAWRDGREHPFYYDTVWDIMRLVSVLQAREDVDPNRIGVIGFSKGGIEAYLAAAVDERIAVAVSCIGVQSFGWALENNAWQSRVGTIKSAFETIAKDAGVARPDAAFARRFYDKLVPGIYDRFDGPAMLPMIAPRPLMVINGDSDDRTPLPGLKLCTDAARQAYSDAGTRDRFVTRIQENTGHKVNPESQAAAIEWFVKWLNPER